jgi:zinc protease
MNIPIRNLSMIAALSVMIVTALGQTKTTDRLPLDPAVRTGKLPNGLSYYIRQNKKPEKKVQLRLVVNAGSILEDPDQQGLAHFMEHMNFNGSTHFPKNELVSYLQSIGVEFGADLNAYTSFDETVYILPVPTDDPAKVDKAFTVLEDWAGRASLETSEIEKERGVVLEESRLGKGAAERMRKKYFPVLLNGSHYAERFPIGKDSILKTFSPDALRRFYHDWYRPNLMAVVVVGDLDPAEAEKQIIRHFTSLKNPARERPRPSIIPIVPRKTNEAMVLTDKEQTQSVLQVINSVEKADQVKTWGDYRKTVIQGLIGSMSGQRYQELTQQPEPPFVFAGSGSGEFLRGYKSNSSFALLGKKPAGDAINAIITTDGSIRKYGFLQSELDRAKVSLMNETEKTWLDRDKTESARYVDAYVSHFLSGRPTIGIDKRYEFLKKELSGITLAEVNAEASKVSAGQGNFALIMAPEKNASTLPTGQQLESELSSAGKLAVVPYQEKKIAGKLVDPLPKAGTILKEVTNASLGTTDLTLSNGITVTLKATDFKNDEILMDAWRPGGYRAVPLDQKLQAQMSAQLVNAMGVKDLSPVDMEKFLAGKSVSVMPYVNANEEGIQGESSVKDLETFFQLVNVYFTHPRKDEKLFLSTINRQKSMSANMKASPFTYFRDTLTSVVYQNNPWADRLMSPEDYDKVSLDNAFSQYQRIFGNADGMHFTFVGSIDMKAVKPLLLQYLASLPGQPGEHKAADVGLRPVRGQVNLPVHRGADQKSLVNIIYSGETPYSRWEDLKARAMTEVMNIRIIEQLREQMSGIYGGGMNGGLAKRSYPNYNISVAFPCGPENVDTLTKALFSIIRSLQQKGSDDKELAKVKETWKKQYEDQVKTNSYWLEGLSTAWIDGEDPEAMLVYLDEVNKLTNSDIQDAANKYLDERNRIQAVLYPAK